MNVNLPTSFPVLTISPHGWLLVYSTRSDKKRFYLLTVQYRALLFDEIKSGAVAQPDEFLTTPPRYHYGPRISKVRGCRYP